MPAVAVAVKVIVVPGGCGGVLSTVRLVRAAGWGGSMANGITLLASGLSASDALKSTFVLACLSPSVVGMGQ